MVSRCGIFCSSTSHAREAYLPIEQLQAHAEIIEASCIVTITQTFTSSQEVWGIDSYARYVFPLPDKAVICDFEMRSEGGRTIVAFVQEKSRAKAVFTKAHKAHRATGLAERVAENMFSISLGSLPESKILTTKLTYATDLSNSELRDQVRLYLPMGFGARFGQGMGDYVPPHRMSFTANIRMKGPIERVTSPTHPHLVTAFASSPDEQLPAYDHEPQCTTSYQTEEFLQTDFILVITSTHLSQPLCVAERHPSGSIAFRLSLVPELKLPLIAKQEYIFMLDRSASMTGSRIETAKKTLVLLLHALPSTGTIFNIFSFGSWHKSLWTESMEYTQETLAEACEHVDEMIANHGGTDICGALRATFASRNRNFPTACFLLTDGEVTGDPAQTLLTVSKEVERSTLLQPLRIFTLGIGEQASVSMCEAIARAGNGICLMATATEDMVAKCARLTRLSRTPICEVSVDYKVPLAKERALFACCARKLALRVQFGELRSPMDGIPATYYALVNKKKYTVPKEVILSVRVVGREDPMLVVVPVEELPYIEDSTQRSQFHLIHTLAVNNIIQRLDAEDDYTGRNKHQILSLAKKYGLVSRYTSLVAADRNRAKQTNRRPVSNGPPIQAFSLFPSFSLFPVRPPARRRRATMSSWSSTLVPKDNAKGKSRGDSTINEDWKAQSPTSPTQTEKKPFQEDSEVDPSILYGQEEYSTPRSPKSARREAYVVDGFRSDGQADVYDPLCEDISPAPNWHPDEYGVARMSGVSPPTPVLRSSGSESGSWRRDNVRSSWKTTVKSSLQFSSTSTSDETSSSADGVDNKTMQLIRLQAFDGSFAATPELEKIVGRAAMNERRRFGENVRVSADVWATVLALVYLQKYLTKQGDLLNALEEKAMGYLKQVGGIPLATLLERANSLLA